MKIRIYSIILIVGLISSAWYHNPLPQDFVYANTIIPDLDVELRYYSTNNFVGDTIDGYNNDVLILTGATVTALKNVQEDLYKKNLCLRIYDGYRPQTAVNHFIRWAKKLDDTMMKQKFYPNTSKKFLFRNGYIASKSGHSRGSTVDLTITNAATDKVLDMGSPYDFFGPISWVDHQDLSDEQKNNRKILQEVMIKNGFRNYPKEWWHFTLRNEPHPNTYFDFMVE